jgi:hypothetical protein
MFIPQGKPVHQNLATSYILVEALVADLHEGGFSGVVEIMLRDTDNHIVFDRGRIAGVIEKRGEAYSLTATVADLAARSQHERGRISIYSYALPVAKAVTGRMFAETLYIKLSTDFADLEKLVNKFMHERDRQWFIEVVNEGSPAMIFIDDGRCSLIQSNTVANENDLEIVGLSNNLALLQLIKKCNSTGGVFDVLFKGAEEKIAPQPVVEEVKPPAPIIEEKPQVEVLPKVEEKFEPAMEERIDEPFPDLGFDLPPVAIDSAIENHSSGSNDFSLQVTPAIPIDEQQEVSITSTTDVESPVYAADTSDLVDPAEEPLKTEIEIPVTEDTGFSSFISASDLDNSENGTSNMVRTLAGTPKRNTGEKPRDIRILPTRELMALSGSATADLQMAEIKGLLGEIAKTIEDVMRIVEQRDDFSMHLRAGQLKLANQYPFLDPFGAEFEYMEGEIVFVGKASAEEFIAGVTDALRLAITSAVQSSANSGRLRSFIIDKLRFVFNRNREEYMAYGLDASLEQIAGVQF